MDIANSKQFCFCHPESHVAISNSSSLKTTFNDFIWFCSNRGANFPRLPSFFVSLLKTKNKFLSGKRIFRYARGVKFWRQNRSIYSETALQYEERQRIILKISSWRLKLSFHLAASKCKLECCSFGEVRMLVGDVSYEYQYKLRENFFWRFLERK